MPRKRDPETGKFIRTRFPWSMDKWNDGYIDNNGRFKVYLPNYPRASSLGYTFRSHAVWWLTFGEVPPENMDVHHKNGDRLDDRLENLELINHLEHALLHNPKDKGVKFVCENCNDIFYVKKWRVNQRKKEGQKIRFCSQECFHDYPRSEKHKKNISRGLRRHYENQD